MQNPNNNENAYIKGNNEIKNILWTNDEEIDLNSYFFQQECDGYFKTLISPRLSKCTEDDISNYRNFKNENVILFEQNQCPDQINAQIDIDPPSNQIGSSIQNLNSYSYSNENTFNNFSSNSNCRKLSEQSQYHLSSNSSSVGMLSNPQIGSSKQLTQNSGYSQIHGQINTLKNLEQMQSSPNHDQSQSLLRKRDRKSAIKSKIIEEDNQEEFEADSEKKRGGKQKKEENVYYAYSHEKINYWQDIIHNGENLSKKEKQMIQNRISAQKFRAKQKGFVDCMENELITLKKQFQQLTQILDSDLCNQCKDTVHVHMNNSIEIKNQQNEQKQNQNMKGGKKQKNKNFQFVGQSFFQKSLIAFIGCIALICFVSYPNNNKNTFQNEFYQNSQSFSRKLQINADEFYTQDYIVLQIATSTSKNIKVIGLSSDKVYDLKQRVQLIEGIPILQQMLFFEGQELQNNQTLISFANQYSQLFLKINHQPQKYQFIVKNHNKLNNTLPLSNFGIVESFEPISFSMYKNHLESMTGLKYGNEFYISIEDKLLSDQDEQNNYLMADEIGIIREYQIYLEENKITKQMFSHKKNMMGDNRLFRNFIQFSTNSMIIDERFQVYHITDFEQQLDTTKTIQLNAIRFNLKERAKYEKQKMFIIDDDDDPLNDKMLFFEKTEFNNFQISQIQCYDAESTDNLEISTQQLKSQTGSELFLNRRESNKQSLTQNNNIQSNLMISNAIPSSFSPLNLLLANVESQVQFKRQLEMTHENNEYFEKKTTRINCKVTPIQNDDQDYEIPLYI